MPIVTSKDGTIIAYDKIGSGPAVILVDAANGYRGFGPMGPLATQLAPTFTVITYDRRGRGESTDTLPYAVEREVEDLAALLEAAGGSACVHGFSSGAILALYAADCGLPITKLCLLEPPLELDEEHIEVSNLGAEIAELVAQGRRGDAVEHFHTSIGVPAEYTAGMREQPFWSTLEGLAHTLVYDTTITSTFPVERVPQINTPTLVLASTGSDDRLLNWATELSEALPNATLRKLQGEWHGIATQVLAAAMTEFFTSSIAIR